jgi:ABC-type oligopeptide transport system substrate-binding subunit
MSKKLTKILSLVLALVMIVALAACGQTTPAPANTEAPATNNEPANNEPANNEPANEEPANNEEPVEPVEEEPVMPEYSFDDNGTYVRADDEDVYEWALGEYAELLADAESEDNTIDERFVKFAKAEAVLLDSAVMIPTTTQNGAYTISRVAPRTVPYVQWGNDDDRWFGMVISDDDFLTPAERDELFAAWNEAVAGGADYDPAAILTANGHALKTDYTTTFSTAPVTIDWLNTSSQSDTEITVQTVVGLVQYDNLNRMQPMLAESWEISDDGTVYTFHIREGAYWYTSEGTEYAEVTAQDFVAGFQHMLDTQAGLEWLVEGVVAGVDDYMYGGESFDVVGYEAPDKYTLVVTLDKPTSYFLTMLTYSCFLPICDSFYQAHGGVYGVEEYAEASADTNAYTFGKSTDVSSQVYCGPFLLQKLQQDSEILVVRNENFFFNDKTTLNSIKWVYDAGENPTATYNDVVAGVYAGATLTEASGTLALAKEDGNFDKYAYISETTSTTYFGGLNLNRGTFALEGGIAASEKTEQQKIDTTTALQNKAFRQALQFAFDKGTQNATSRGEDLKYTNLRNMYTHPEFVSLSEDTTVDGVTFAAGTFYGEMVQYFLDEMGSPIKVADQIDGWYNPEIAKEKLAQAKEELGDLVSYPIIIDVVYYSPSAANTAQAQAYKQVIEACLGAENVQVNLIETTTSQDFYACGYRAANGEAGNFDMFYGSGWGPDYGDPSTYLDTFAGEGAGYMTKVIGLF